MPLDLLCSPFLNPDQLRLADVVEEFAADRIAPLTGEVETRGPHTDHSIREELTETGWLGALIGAEWGGLDLGHVEKTLITEILSRFSPVTGAIYQASVLGAATIVEYGGDEMRRTWLPEIAAGRCWPSIAVTDPHQGSHIRAMGCTARRVGDSYVLNGEKVLVGNAALGDVHCVVASTGERGQRGSLTAFLVEKDTEGLEVVHEPANALHGFSVDTLRLTDVQVPASRIIGGVGAGEEVAQSASVVYGRLNLAAVALGIQRRMLEATELWVSARPRYGGCLSDLEPVRRRIAEMWHHLMHTVQAVYSAAQTLDGGTPCDALLYHAKLTAHRAGVAVGENAKQLHGGHSGRVGSEIEQLRRDMDLVHAPAGTDDLQIKRLGEHVLGPHHPQWSARHIARRHGSLSSAA